jgi:DnaK suppressor protein
MSEDGLGADEIERFRILLLARRDDLASLETISDESRRPVELDQQSVGRLSRMDAIQQQAMALASQQRRRNESQQIGAALKRIDEGDFGWCAACGEAIPRGRLEIDPTVTLCVVCASDR